MSPDKSPSASKQFRKLGPGQRVSRACLHCRQRKSRCDLDSGGNPGTPPCQRCVREGRDCVLGSSNRGGRRIRKSKIINLAVGGTININDNIDDGESITQQPTKDPSSAYSESQSLPASSRYSVADINASPAGNPPESATAEDDDAASTSDSAIDSGVPRNPSDAWQCLTGIAKRGGAGGETGVAGHAARLSQNLPRVPEDAFTDNGLHVAPRPTNSGIRAYKLVQNGSLDSELIFQLIRRYEEHFHPYQPLVPRKYFDRAALDAFASTEKHLLTAVLTIASKDLVDTPHIHEYCSKYMHELISGIAAGADCDVEAVEALILLAEWEPQGLRPNVERVGRGEEDRAAWMHVGLALRSGYFLGLDRTSFRGDPSSEDCDARKRLAWTSCYISDRLISVRIGRAFWSRGPGPMTGFVSQDFPSLQPVHEGDEDYAKIIQATLDLTQLYGNVHEILYSGMRTSNQMMLMGDYIKYADDFRTAISRWNRTWGNLDCSPRIKVTLQMSYEYLRLYTNAFAFQAAISQAMVRKPKSGDQHSQREHLRATFSNVASMSDARFIYESLDAAKSYLDILVSTLNPEQHLRFMPLRFYLYSIYAAVFLYKARSFGVLAPAEEIAVRDLVSRTTEQLQRASAGPDDMGSRYARLLELLWKPHAATAIASSPKSRRNNHSEISIPSLTNIPDQQPQQMHFSPANDFSWLDLGAVGDYVSGDQMTAAGILGYDGLVNELKQLDQTLRISIHQVDVGEAGQIERMFTEIDAQHGQRPDILVSNAGYGKRVPQVWDITLEEFDYTIQVNLRASFILVKGVVERMKSQRWGRIVFMSSIAGYGGGINGCHYAASKAGMTGMMRNLSTRLAEFNISVNDVSPAMIGDTGMIPSATAIAGTETPLGRLGVPQEVANVVTMLVTTGYMTGQSLLLAGGLK
ncbi:hypothetical protein BGW36DRAFT_294388 [Talaromyces proteolyticus]|uniref:Zn(2)-C6 fungal-type domain-containing protein n=1 Tax=Talaromyces proteolyticus TaxID=1131652 RepID=A0AAD4KXE6_9EURO|nr:uncharacterized protein BGW36DRAFT_294388 [Talaromyces proteolyticus]KAH8699003.1 hypothetical protein BGW36DRAFT_294388 [Talaromyces proteolyticus]